MSSVKITLIEPISLHEQVIKEVEIRQPTYKEYIRFGNPSIWSGSRDGGVFEVPNLDAIKGYLEACTAFPEPAALNLLSLADSLRVVDVVQGFFDQARLAMKTASA